MQCDGWVSVDFDYSKAPSGWGNLNPFIQAFFIDCAAGQLPAAADAQPLARQLQHGQPAGACDE